MNKAHENINWENYPSDNTALNAENLNKMDVAIDNIDNRVVSLDSSKATKTEVSTLVADVSFEESTGIITVTKKNGSKITIDTQMEKIAVNFSYDRITQQIILTLIDGAKQYIDLSALITQYEFIDSDTIAFSIDSNGGVTAKIKEGSITEEYLEQNYLSNIKVEVEKTATNAKTASEAAVSATASKTAAAASQKLASTSESNAASSATLAYNYAVGESNSAKYYAEQAKAVSESLKGSLKPMGTVTFANLPALSTASAGDMYNVSTSFTTTSSFKEGAGNIIAEGANVYKTADGYWDILAGTPVAGVKGNAESTYRTGNVNITPTDIGALSTTGESSNTTVKFTESTSRTKPTTGEKLSSIVGKIVKFLSDLKTVAFSGSYNDLSNKPISLPANGGNSATVNGHTVNEDVPSGAKFTDTHVTVADNLTSTSTTSALSANQGRILKNGLDEVNQSLESVVQMQTIVATTDEYGDIELGNIKESAIVSVIQNRTYGNGTYTEFFIPIYGGTNTQKIKIAKCLKDNNTNLTNTKVAVDVYYISVNYIAS